MIDFDSSVCRDVDGATHREWLETNGIGGFAMSTVIGLNTRRYHGLLVAAIKPPAERAVLLSKLEEVLILREGETERRFDLSSNQYPGVIHPHGYEQQTGFRLDPYPIFRYECDGVTIAKHVFLAHDENTVCIEYVAAGEPERLGGAQLEIRPLVAFRHYHQLVRMNANISREVEQADGVLTITPYEAYPPLHFAHNAARVKPQGDWYNAFNYLVEKERGYDYVEDLFNPFTLTFELEAGAPARIVASTQAHASDELDALRQAELARRSALRSSVAKPDEFARALAVAADQFVVKRSGDQGNGEGYSIIAGYPWFADWGRDAMIALPGLTLATGRADVARSVLLTYASAISEGMIPNRFLDRLDGEAGHQMEYNTIDGALWMIEAARSYAQHTADYAFVERHLYTALKSVVDFYVKGTRYHIHMDDDGLVSGGEEGIQLTWMDAKVDNWVVTPRYGKPVSIQALWFNALRTMQDFAQRFGEEADGARYAELAERACDSFNRVFWNDSAECLYDVIAPNGTPDVAIRPNQILAVSLTHSMLSAERMKKVVAVTQRELLTPVGLRSLAPGHYDYRGKYEGNLISRDSAYHQGTVWAWLMGPFITAYLKVNERSAQSQTQARRWLAAFEEQLNEAGLGQISEIFDGNEPHTPRGCVAQAWSVGELLRVMVEDLG